MKKMIYRVLLTMVCLVAQQVAISAQSACDVVFDFENDRNLEYAITNNAGTSTIAGTASVYEETASNNVLKVATSASNGYIKLTITLPDGKTLVDFSSTLSLKIYLTTTGDTQYKQLKYGLNGIANSDFLGGNLARSTWHTGTISLNSLSSSLTSFYILIGCNWGASTFYIDDISLPFTGTCEPQVSKHKPVITTTPILSSIECGQTLGNVIIDTNGVATYTPEEGEAVTIEGSFAFETPTTVVKLSDNGITEYKLIFTPSDTETYDIASVNVTVTVNDNGNCTTPCPATAGYLMLDCFNDKELGTSYAVYKAENTSSATVSTVVTDPSDENNQVIKFENKNYGHYLRLTVSLPCNNRILGNYSHVRYKIYSAATFTDTHYLGINGTMASVGNGTATKDTWVTIEKEIPSTYASSTLTEFTLELGARTGAKDYYIDDIELKEKANLPDCNDGGTTTWVGTTTDWLTYTNWNPKYVPTSSNNAIIPQVSTYPVLTAPVTVRQLTLEPGAALDLGAYTLSASTSIKAQILIDSQQWYSIGFPFDVATVYSEDYKDVLDAGTNFWLSSYNGTAFSPAITIGNTTGYIIELPLGFGTGKTISYISGAVVNLGKGALTFSESYTLQANPSLAPLSITSGTDNKYIYKLQYNEEVAEYVRADGATTIAPFESVITVEKVDAPQRISLNTDVVTGIAPVVENDVVVATQYYNLQGVTVGALRATPLQPGIYIMKTIYESGKSEVSKVIK